MGRVTLDCRRVPSESSCSLTITGEEDEVLRAGVAHAVDVHGHTDGEELRAALRASMTGATDEATALELRPGEFVQVIEFRTDRPDRVDEFAEMGRRWEEEIGHDRTARWSIVTVDRADPTHLVQVVAFPDHDSAMANSKHPATGRIAERIRGLCVGEPVFHDLDVREVQGF